MARRYHINPETGRPNICRAQTPERCEYAQNGEVPEHYDTKEEAREAYAKSMSDQTVSTVSASSGGADEGKSFSSYVAVFVKGDDPEFPDMHRMYATKDIPALGIKKGDRGGLVENPERVTGNAWVDEKSRVEDDASVRENATVLNSVTCEYATVSGRGLVKNSTVSGVSRVLGVGWVENSKLQEASVVQRNARVEDSTLLGEPVVSDFSSVTSSEIYGESSVWGRSVISDSKVFARSEVIDSVVSDAILDGWVSVADSNVTHGSLISGDAHVYDSDIYNSSVYGSAFVKESKISRDTQVGGWARVISSEVSNKSQVFEGAQVIESTVDMQGEVTGDAEVTKSSVTGGRVYGNASVSESSIGKYVKVGGHASVSDATTITGDVTISDYADVARTHISADDVFIEGNARVKDVNIYSSTGNVFIGGDAVVKDCEIPESDEDIVLYENREYSSWFFNDD